MFAETFKRLRLEKGISQANFADYFNLTQQAVGKWEKGTATPDYETLKKIAAFFNVTTDYLLGTPAPDTQYYDDPEVARMANELKNNPDLHILFDASKKLTKKDLEAVITIVQKMSSEE